MSAKRKTDGNGAERAGRRGGARGSGDAAERAASAAGNGQEAVSATGVRRTFRLTRAGWGFLAVCILLILGAFNAELNVIVLLASLALAFFLAGLIAPLWTGYGIVCRREMPDGVFAGEPFRYTLAVRSRRLGEARRVRLRDPLAGSPEGGLLAPKAPARGTARFSALGAPMRRGVYPAPALSWRSGFPFGVAERGGRRAGEGELVVYPARGRLTREGALAGDRADASARTESATGTPREDFRTLRDYQPGDNPKRIHWRTSARLGKLLVRELERDRPAPVMVLMDSRIPARTEPAGLSEAKAGLELAVSFAAEACRSALAQGEAVELIGFFPEPKRLRTRDDGGARGRPLPARVQPLLEALARLTPSDAETPEALVRLAEEAGLRLTRGVVAVSPTRATARALADALPAEAVQVHAASDPAFAGVFRLLAPPGRETA